MFANKVMQPITNVGTGAFQLDANGTGSWKTWRSQFATAAQVAYYAENDDGTEWEFGYGVLTYGTPDQISRNVILSSTGSAIDWTSGDGAVYVMSVPWAQAMEGRWDAAASMFAAAGRKPFTAVGAANKTVTAADAGGRFSLNTSAAARTVTLPALSAVTMGFNIEVLGTSQATYLNLTPSGSDVIDAGGAGATLVAPGRVPILIYSDGSQWRTSLDYAIRRTVGPLYTAVGAAGKTVAATDAWGKFTLDNSAAARTVTLPAISGVPVGFGVEVFGLSQAYYLNIAPNGSDAVDGGSAGQTLPLPGKVWVSVWSDGTQWRTDFDYSAMHVMATALPSGAAAVDFTSLPYWANNVEAEFHLVPATDGVDLYLRTYGADGVLDAGGSDYAFAAGAATSSSTSGFAGTAAGSAIGINRAGNAVDNSASVGIQGVVKVSNVRASIYTLAVCQATYLDSGGAALLTNFGGGWRAEADLITGVRLVFSSGNCSGRVTLRVGA